MIKKKFKSAIRRVQYWFSKRRINALDCDLKIYEINKKFLSRSEIYGYFHHYFWNRSPDWLSNHYKYFSLENRAFGEAAFHAMWFFLFNEFRFKKILEIGVYRGSTLSLFKLLSNKLNYVSEVHGISPFSNAGDSVSSYSGQINYKKDVINNFKAFNLNEINLHCGYSTDNSMIELIINSKWDLIFIDGNHDLHVVEQDFKFCSDSMNSGGVIVLDDSSLYTDYRPSLYSTKGHPGPSKVADGIDKAIFTEILSVGHNRVFIKN
jgi:hypothetical protein